MRDSNRQGFLDPELSLAQQHVTVGVVGCSGGGAPITQQLAHNRFRRYVIYDPKPMEAKHEERLVGAWHEDTLARRPKTEIATRVIKKLRPEAEVEAISDCWQNRPDPLKRCDLIFTAVDSLRARRDLERFARQFCIPMIDIGMKVTAQRGQPPRVAGQVILSVPGRPCMWCMKFLRDELLDQEGAEYGDAGGYPQVVNVNAILAGAAVWSGIDLLTAKVGHAPLPSYLCYDGNRNSMQEHNYWPLLRDVQCPHYPLREQGDTRIRAA